MNCCVQMNKLFHVQIFCHVYHLNNHVFYDGEI